MNPTYLINFKYIIWNIQFSVSSKESIIPEQSVELSAPQEVVKSSFSEVTISKEIVEQLVAEDSFKPTVSHVETMLVSEPILSLASSPKSIDPEITKELSPVPESPGIPQSSVSVSSTTGPAEVVMVDEETRMSAETNSRAQTPAKQVFMSLVGMF